MSKDNPLEIAEHLVLANDLKGAIQAANDGIAKSHQNGDNYILSVWREVRRKLIEMETKAG